MNDMNMDWFMLIRVEIEDKPEVFKYLRHSNIICYFIDKDITISLKYQNSFKQMSARRRKTSSSVVNCCLYVVHVVWENGAGVGDEQAGEVAALE